jgi:hypothetical protein
MARPPSDGGDAVATSVEAHPGSAGILPAADGDDAVATQGEGADAELPEDDETLLGELFDLVARKRAQHSDVPSSEKLQDKEESHVKISLPQPAPSWDDAPLEEDGDFWQKLYNLDKWKYWKIGAVLAGLCLLALIVFSVVLRLHSKPKETNPSVASQTTIVPELQPEPVPATPTQTPTPTPAPTPTPTPTPTQADGRTIYTANLIPPPDSYVE